MSEDTLKSVLESTIYRCIEQDSLDYATTAQEVAKLVEELFVNRNETLFAVLHACDSHVYQRVIETLQAVGIENPNDSR
jgi:hypothetical protein